MTATQPWLPVFGYGGHIKATTQELIIMHGGVTRRYPLQAVKHLLVVGGHTLHTSAVTNLLKSGAVITFFDIDGIPVGYLYPYGYRPESEVRTAQERAAPHRFAQPIATASLQSRLLLLEELCNRTGKDIFYAGELDLLYQARDELAISVTMEGLRRLSRLTGDMYYEILSRTLPPELGFRRRTNRPYLDPVNAMFALGYAMLYGNCCVSLVGAHLDPDLGMLHEGAGSLVYDLIEPQKAVMVDRTVIRFAREEISEEDYECTGKRCYLDGNFSTRLVQALRDSIDQSRIDAQVRILRDALLMNTDFHVLYW
ncbi:MAG TPA: CRISPR-associated endonuclease Cas1 [Candidatus Methanoculleus thermohydrogenotrophicum]|jgi:CRISPR-associated endonuclease Cas1|nr:CRISPR-associated endonuclease Cas1 [Candidatus Methanoculleus thermohydrogenotrophicum]HQE09633.1 CRISPR-associated endonuclease Cas1 [Bacillota bacterium]NLM81963.1 CRISPR-associated endonuclease Cas1 [Candidatus Methanoculleus thermohydrogenotrophicum]HOB17493.1 CRISPR-associated endonuclease Cas1 [Candidatus Methanoculleus thermohydrogenotrophicum]HPZ37648.1 CRISPR-associated endonuclease Cas1 [Candidatus Methanoculleus thermohydrogenotrophicum]